MNRFLLEGGISGGTIAIYVVLIVMLVLMLVLPYFSNRKKNKEYQSMLDSLKVGDMVRTAGGVIGRIIKITDKGEIKTVVIETGTKTEKSYMEFDLSMIYCVLKSSKAESEETKTETEDEKVEEVKAEEPATPAPEAQASEAKEEKPTAAKKTTKARTSTKKKAK